MNDLARIDNLVLTETCAICGVSGPDSETDGPPIDASRHDGEPTSLFRMCGDCSEGFALWLEHTWLLS